MTPKEKVKRKLLRQWLAKAEMTRSLADNSQVFWRSEP